jgi:hypothetical protein
VYSDRIVRFMSAFAHEATTPFRLDIIEALLHRIVPFCAAKDNNARWRLCQLVHCMMVSVPEDAALSDSVADLVQAALLDRLLTDARPQIRAVAAQALSRLPCPDFDAYDQDPNMEQDFTRCPVTTAMLDVLAGDKSGEVRAAMLASLPPGPCTYDAMIERTNDEADSVRRMAFLAIADKIPPARLTSPVVATLLRRGLRDRAPKVVDAATLLVTAWLDSSALAGGDPLALLRWVDAASHPEEAELALRTLLSSGRLDAIRLAKLSAEEGLGLRMAPSAVLAKESCIGPEEALLWRIVCDVLSSEATAQGLAAAIGGGAPASISAAAAGDRLEALEAALPASVDDAMSLIDAHLDALECGDHDSNSNNNSKASQSARKKEHEALFTISQMVFLTASCLEFTDASARKSATALLNRLLGQTAATAVNLELSPQPPGKNQSMSLFFESIGLLLQRVHGDRPLEMAETALNALIGEEALESVAHDVSLMAVLLESLAYMPLEIVDKVNTVMKTIVHPCFNDKQTKNNGDVIKEKAARCIGLYSLLDGTDLAWLGVHLRMLGRCLADSTVSDPDTFCAPLTAVKALSDLAVRFGLPTLNEAAHQGCNVEDAATGVFSLLDLLLAHLPTHMAQESHQRPHKSARKSCTKSVALLEIGTEVVEGMVRLLICDAASGGTNGAAAKGRLGDEELVVKLLVILLLAGFDAATESAPKMRQMLQVFFERYATLSLTSQMYLATAFLPAARCALETEAASAPRVIRFALQLLQMPVYDRHGKRETYGHEQLAELLLGEISRTVRIAFGSCTEKACAQGSKGAKVRGIKPIKFKGSTHVTGYLAALCETLSFLPLNLNADQFDGEATNEGHAERGEKSQAWRIAACAAKLGKSLSSSNEKLMQKVVERMGLVEHLDRLDPDEIVGLLSALEAAVEEFCEGYPDPLLPTPISESPPRLEEGSRGRRKGRSAAPGKSLAESPFSDTVSDEEFDEQDSEYDDDDDDESADDDEEKEENDEEDESEQEGDAMEEEDEVRAASQTKRRETRRASAASVEALRLALSDTMKL